MSAEIFIAPLTAEAFAPFGDVLDASGAPDKMINAGMCGRHHDLAQLQFASDGRAGISVFNAEPRDLPYQLDLLERHPLGSQAFLPLTGQPFLVIVAPDEGGRPGVPLAFETAPHQGINFHAGTWHGVLTPLAGPGLFAVVDRIGPGDNLDECSLAAPYTIVRR
ncbi:MAG: ureidoglycolate lyase [Sulfitobacter sp.]